MWIYAVAIKSEIRRHDMCILPDDESSKRKKNNNNRTPKRNVDKM